MASNQALVLSLIFDKSTLMIARATSFALVAALVASMSSCLCLALTLSASMSSYLCRAASFMSIFLLLAASSISNFFV